MYKKFLIGNGIVVGLCCLAYRKLTEKKNQDLYKRTRAFDEAISTLRSHKGAKYFLGEPINDGLLHILEEKKGEDDTTTYHVKVAVSGSKNSGNMHFWLRRKGEDPDVDVYRIELQIHKIKDYLLVKSDNAGAESVTPAPAT